MNEKMGITKRIDTCFRHKIYLEPERAFGSP